MGHRLGAFQVEEPTILEGAGPVLERATTSIWMEGITFPITPLLVCRLAAELSKFLADAWVVEPAILSPGAVTSGEKSTCFL